MANKEHLALLKRGVKSWNEWRQKNGSVEADLTWDDVTGADFAGVTLTGADLAGANLSKVDLSKANLSKADLSKADLGNEPPEFYSCFICYAHTDSTFVLALVTHLKQHGVPVWIDQWNIPAGANFNRSIDEAITTCAQLLLVLSPAAVESTEVEGEWLTALEEGKPIIPVLHQACRIPRQLRARQWVDFTGRSSDDEAALKRILSVLARKTAPIAT